MLLLSINLLINEYVDDFSSPITYEPERPGDIRDIIFSNNCAREELNWEPVYTLEEGLYEMLGYKNDLL